MISKRILLVEDHEDNRNIYCTILEHYGYEVLLATDGRAAIELAREERPDLILMDLSIPVVDGWEATRVLKASMDTREIPIVALSAHALEEDRERAREAGCDGYLAKPVEPRTVLREVGRFLRDGVAARGSRHSPPVFLKPRTPMRSGLPLFEFEVLAGP